MSKTFNIYCDESCHIENDHRGYMFLGSICAPYNKTKEYTQEISELKRKHHFYAEIKWTSVSKSKLDFYCELIEFFFKKDLIFRAVGVKKNQIKNDEFQQSYDEFYYKMYYYLLNHNINSSYNYNVYLDIKDTLSARKVRKLKDILNTKYGVFRNIQNIHSRESLILQVADFLMGAVSYYMNNKEKVNLAKVVIVNKIIELSGIKLDVTNYSDKFNLFYINLR